MAGVAQLAEQLICNQQVRGSSPSASSILKEHLRTPFFRCLKIRKIISTLVDFPEDGLFIICV